MNTAGATALSIADVEEAYREKRKEYRERSARGKWKSHAIRAILAARLTLVLAVMYLVFPDLSGRSLVLNVVIPTLSAAVLVLMWCEPIFRMGWANHRIGAERLKRACMAFHAKLPPYNKPDALERFQETIDAIDRNVASEHKVSRWSKIWQLFLWRAQPDKVRLEDSLKLDKPELTSDQVINSRLRQQQNWYIGKARRYLLVYSVFQALLMGIFLWHLYSKVEFGPDFRTMALVMAVGLAVVTFRDFLGYRGQFSSYLAAASELAALEKKYKRKETPFNEGTEDENRRLLVERVEEVLQQEQDGWYQNRLS